MAALIPAQQTHVIELYESGLSAQEVADYFGVGIGAIFYVLRRTGTRRRTTAESNRLQFERKPLSYCIKQNLTDAEERLRFAAVMLYWAEGYKVGKDTVDFANSDPAMAVIFIRFLREVCCVDERRIRASLYTYEGQNLDALHQFWSAALNLPLTQFNKPYVKRSAPGSRGPRMLHGLVHVRYCDTKLLRQILDWIDEYRAECVGGRVVNCDWL